MLFRSIDVTFVCASAKRTPGTEFRSKETIQSLIQIFGSLGSANFRTLRNITRVNAPSAHLPKATPKGVRNVRPCFMKRNEQPQTKPSAKYEESQLLLETCCEVMEPPVRIELTTFRLQGGCSTTELGRRETSANYGRT